MCARGPDNRSILPGFVFLQQISCIFYFSVAYHGLDYLFDSCFYIHFLHTDLFCLASLLLVLLVLLLLSKEFLLISILCYTNVYFFSGFTFYNFVSFWIYDINVSLDSKSFISCFFDAQGWHKFLCFVVQIQIVWYC